MQKHSKLSALGVAAVLAVATIPAARAQNDPGRDIVSPTYSESVLISFTGNSGAAPGSGPCCNLIQASDGNFYGTTSGGGATGNGAVFRMITGGAYSVLYSFAGSPDGADPDAGLVQGTDGNFYGTTNGGGATGDGSAFRLTPSGALTVLHSFSSALNDGSFPRAGLVQGIDGNFYGTTGLGGASHDGTVFKLTPEGTFTLLHSFSGSADGASPDAGLVQGVDGSFYGTTLQGGAHGDGTVFQIGPGGVFTLLHSFGGGVSDGSGPYAGLMQGADGKFYGTTTLGGASNNGTVFQISSGGAFALLHSFPFAAGDGTDPAAALAQGADGNFYGTANSGGAVGYGGVFQISSGGDYRFLYSFGSASNDGDHPGGAGLVQGADGNFYGVTKIGSTQLYGTLYRIAVSSPAAAAPVQVTAPSSVAAGASFSLSYLATNATSDTMQQCFATNNAGQTDWTGIRTAAAVSNIAALTAPSTAGSYTYALTCGGMETGATTLTVSAPPTSVKFSSVGHNFGSANVGGAAPAYGVEVTNTGNTTVTATGVALNGSPEFTDATNCGATLAAGKSCELVFYFKPTATGTATAGWSISGTLGVSFTPSNGGTLTGTGVTNTGAFTLTTAGHNFGDVGVNDTSPIYGTVLTNSSSAMVSLTYANVAAPFLLSGSNCGAALAAGASCNLQFECKPEMTGSFQQKYGITAVQGGKPATITSGGTIITGVTLTGAGE
jgi:uncharacterized repeat protein (TIGR03803 family)